MMETVTGMEDHGFTIKDSARFDYVKELDDIISNMHPGEYFINKKRKKLIPVREILKKATISVEEYNQIGLEIQCFLLFITSEESLVLEKVLVFISVNLLKKGVNHLVGSSFYPSKEDLESVFLDGKNLTPEEFIYLFSFLARKTDDETNFPSTFLEEALDNIRKEREK